jgi:hypothetical protein
LDSFATVRLRSFLAIGLLFCALILPSCSSNPGGISCQQYKDDLVLALTNPRDESLPKSLADIDQPYRSEIIRQRQRFYSNWYGPLVEVRGVYLPRVPANAFQRAQLVSQFFAFSSSVQSRAMSARGC